VKSRQEGAKYVCFDGSDELAKGVYGTSIPLEVALNPHNDILLAYHMNDERLPPDHGFPGIQEYQVSQQLYHIT